MRKAIFDMKDNTAPGPDGFGVFFYKTCWSTIKEVFMEMINDFYLGSLDIARLNYGVITLVPKVAEANNVKLFQPTCLLNVSFKIFTKLLVDRLARMDYKIISPYQTTLVKGRYIVDGAVMLHEIVRELQSKNMRGLYSRYILKKLMTVSLGILWKR